MVKRGWFAVASLAAAAPLMAQAPEGMPPGMAALRAEEAKVPPPTKVIRYGPDDLRAGDLRLPAGKGPFPVAMLIHGGCWTAFYETRKGTSPLAEALRARGIAVWNVEYRRVGDPGAGWPGTFQDIAAAMDYLPVLAKSYPLDLKRLTIVGHSAGAHLAVWAASRGKLPAPWTAPAAIRPRSVVLIDGPATLAPFVGPDQEVCGQPVIVPLMGGTPAEKPAEYKLASAADHLPLGMRQVMVQAALGPFMVPYTAAAKAAGDPVAVLEPADANHFDIITPGTANGKAVADFIAREAFAAK